MIGTMKLRAPRQIIGALLAPMLMVSASSVVATPQRVDAIPFQSVSMTDSQLLTGKGGSETTLAGVLRLPEKEDNPVVVILHGSSGYLGYIDEWVQLLNSQGIGTFVIDSFSGRGLVRVADDQGKLGRLSSVRDAYAALDVLSQHKMVDPERIALMGFSRGGQGALYSSMQRFQDLYAGEGESFAGVVSFYPNCSFRYQGETKLIDKAVRVFHGEADDFNAFEPCKGYVERAQTGGADISMTGYPGAYHGFDGRDLPESLFSPNGQSARNCDIREEAPGKLINQATGKVFSWDDACVERGIHLGYNEAGALDSKEKVPAFFKELFNMK